MSIQAQKRVSSASKFGVVSHYKLISLLKENVVNFDGVIGTMKDPWQTAIYKNHLITENKTPGLFPHGMMQHSQVDELLENKKKMAAVSIGPTVPTVATGPEGMDTELKKAARTIKEFAERMERDDSFQRALQFVHRNKHFRH